MTTSVVTVDRITPYKEIATLMAEHRVSARPDEDIAREVNEMLSQILLADPASITARVRNGVVTLTGQAGSAGERDLIPVAVRLTWDIDGVVDVVNKLGAAVPG